MLHKWGKVFISVLLYVRSCSAMCNAMTCNATCSCVGAWKPCKGLVSLYTFSHFLATSGAFPVWLLSFVCLFVAWVALSCPKLCWSCCGNLVLWQCELWSGLNKSLKMSFSNIFNVLEAFGQCMLSDSCLHPCELLLMAQIQARSPGLSLTQLLRREQSEWGSHY